MDFEQFKIAVDTIACIQEGTVPTKRQQQALDVVKEFTTVEHIQALAYALKSAELSADFYKRRVDQLQAWQSKMRDPERTIVCDILANGHTLPDEHAGNRYKLPESS